MFGVSHSQIVRTIPVLIAACLLALPAQAKYSGGTGEPNNPYQIATAADLIALGETPADYDKHFIVTADIDLAGHVFNKAIIAPDVNDKDADSGFDGTPFTGVFDGNDHTISHLTIRGHDYLGLFGKLTLGNGSGGEVKNLGVVDVSIVGSGGKIVVSPPDNIVGSGGNIGGLVGYNYCGSVTQCYSTGSVSGRGDSGGLVGFNSRGRISVCYNTGSVSSMSGDAGGLVGYNAGGTISACFNTGSVRASRFGGGLVGHGLDGVILVCYSTGSVSGDLINAGGLVGYNAGGTISASYSTGSVSGSGFVGGLVGFNFGSNIWACFWDMETSGQTRSDGGIGLPTSQMVAMGTFVDAGWDFLGERAKWLVRILANASQRRISRAKCVEWLCPACPQGQGDIDRSLSAGNRGGLGRCMVPASGLLPACDRHRSVGGVWGHHTNYGFWLTGGGCACRVVTWHDWRELWLRASPTT